MSNNIRNFKELMIGNKEKNIKPMTIEIPMLQRDYAQGRKETKTTQIRERFLTSIFEVLSGEKANLHLEFIYGSVKNGKFIPLDGQQRLTTLFLLHWYFGFDELKDGEKSNILKDGDKSKFRYETRASSREFCDMLVNLSTKELEEALEAELKDLKTKKEKHEKDLKNKEESLKKLEEKKTLEKKIKELKEKIAELEKEIKEKSKISYYIKNRAEFLPFWEKDPTVKSMLNMLDTIHEKTKISKNIKPENLNNIDFDFLNMGEFGLSDELYIKMNARGKRLTEFEIFKAKFEELLEKNKFEDLLKTFKDKIDGDWAEKFWKFRDKSKQQEKDYNPAKSVDDAFMSYFYFISEMLFYKSKENSQKEAKNDEKVEFDKNKALEIYENSQENIEFLFSALDNVYEIEKYANEIFKEVPIYWGKQDTDEKTNTDEDTKAKQLLIKIEKGYYEKVIYFIIISNYKKENTKYLVRQARNIMCSIKQPNGNGDVFYKSNLRAQDIYSILNLVDDKKINFTRNKELFEEKQSISSLQNIQETIFKLEDNEIIQGDLGAVYTAYGDDTEKYKILLENIGKLLNANPNTNDILSMILSKYGFCFNEHGWTGIGKKYFIGSETKNCWNFVFSNNDNDKYKDIINLFAEENLDPKSICEQYIENCEKQKTRDWRYYFVKYRDTFFKEKGIKFYYYDDKKIEKSEEKNRYRNVFIKKDDSNFVVEKMGSPTIRGCYFNPFVYCAVIKNIEEEFDKNTKLEDRKYFIKYDDKGYSYLKIENFIEKLSCLDDGWHIEFDKNFDFSAIADKLKPSENPNEFTLAHDPNNDTIENLQKLLENLKNLA